MQGGAFSKSTPSDLGGLDQSRADTELRVRHPPLPLQNPGVSKSEHIPNSGAIPGTRRLAFSENRSSASTLSSTVPPVTLKSTEINPINSSLIET